MPPRCVVYFNTVGVDPIVYALREKRMRSGSVLQFMMVVTVLSLSVMIILRKVLKSRLLPVFTGTMPVTINEFVHCVRG